VNILNDKIDEFNRKLVYYKVGTGEWINYQQCVDGLGAGGRYILNTRTYTDDAKATDMSSSTRYNACANYFKVPVYTDKDSADTRKDVFKLKRASI